VNDWARRLSRLLRQFFRWWGAELNACATDCIGVLAPTWRRPVTVYVDKTRLLIRAQASTGPVTLAEIKRDHSRAPLPDSLPDSLSRGFNGGRRARLVLATENAFLCQWQLPLAAAGHLKSAIALQLSKLMPMPTSLLLTDFEIAAANPSQGIISVDVAALKQADIGPLVKAIGAWGLRVTSIGLSDAPDGPERFRFASPDAPAREGGVRRSDRVLMVAAAALSVTCAALAAMQTYRSHQALEQAMAQTGTAATAALGEREVLINRLEPLIALSQAESAPDAAALLAEVTRLVPHDAWLTTFELKDRHVRLVGLSPDPAAVVRLLAGSALLTDVELRSSLSAGIGTGKDRFELTAESRNGTP
jgi:hypothetical protein